MGAEFSEGCDLAVGAELNAGQGDEQLWVVMRSSHFFVGVDDVPPLP